MLPTALFVESDLLSFSDWLTPLIGLGAAGLTFGLGFIVFSV